MAEYLFRRAFIEEVFGKRGAEAVLMSVAARALFETLRAKILAIDSDIIELAEQNSVSYHGRAFFVEVLPRTNRLIVLLALDFNEVDDPSGIAEDTSSVQFFVNAIYEGGVYVRIMVPGDVERAMPMIRQARELARV